MIKGRHAKEKLSAFELVPIRFVIDLAFIAYSCGKSVNICLHK